MARQTMQRYSVNELSKMKVVDLRRVLGSQNVRVRQRVKTIIREGYASRPDLVPVRGLRKQQLIMEILKVNKWLTGASGSATRIRKSERDAIRTFHDKGYDFINHGNIKDFGRFMGDVRERHGKLEFSSEVAINIYKNAEKRGISAEELNDVFGRYMDNEKHLTDLQQALAGKKAYRTSNVAKIQKTLEFLGW